MRILVAEDSEKLGRYVRQTLERDGFSVDLVADGLTAERMGGAGDYDLIVLDLMMPGKGGLAVCQDLRAKGVSAPIIMATAKGELDERVEGLDAGADDYLVKPYAMEELSARVRALLRRPAAAIGVTLEAGDLSLDWAARRLTQAGVEVPLSAKELSMIEYLMRRRGEVVTRANLLEHCWDFAYDGASNVVDVHIRSIRKKLNDNGERYIETVRGTGYRIRG